MLDLVIDLNGNRRQKFIQVATTLRHSKHNKVGTGSILAWGLSLQKIHIMDQLNSIPVSFAVVGGVATRYYMPERQTQDLDILIAVDDYSNACQYLQSQGGTQLNQLAPDLPQTIGSTWQLPDGQLLDVLASQLDWVKNAIARSIVYDRDPQELPIIGLEYLVLMKLFSARTQDLADISRMMGYADEDIIKSTSALVKIELPSALEDLENLIQLGKLELGL